MVRRIWVSLLIVSILTLCLVPAAVCMRINPYLPENAVMAEPPTPYNLDNVVPGGRIGYQPCGGPWQPGALMPELPPIWEPVMGPFYLPVPVP
jgi:hypothetical protein